MTTTPQGFVDKLYPYAVTMCNSLSVDPKYARVFLAQWAHESGYESKNWVGFNNYSGITNGGPPNFLKFETADEHVVCQLRNLLILHYDKYESFIKAMREGKTAEQVIHELGKSPWDAGGYGVEFGMKPGALLLQRYDEMEMYFPVTRVTPPTPTWGGPECDYLIELGLISQRPDLDKPVTFRWAVTILARLASKIWKDGRFFK